MALYCDFSVSDGRRNPQSLLCAKIYNPVFIWSLGSMRLQVVESDEWVSSKVIQSFSYPLWVTELLSLSHSLERKHCENKQGISYWNNCRSGRYPNSDCWNLIITNSWILLLRLMRIVNKVVSHHLCWKCFLEASTTLFTRFWQKTKEKVKLSFDLSVRCCHNQQVLWAKLWE